MYHIAHIFSVIRDNSGLLNKKNAQIPQNNELFGHSIQR